MLWPRSARYALQLAAELWTEAELEDLELALLRLEHAARCELAWQCRGVNPTGLRPGSFCAGPLRPSLFAIRHLMYPGP